MDGTIKTYRLPLSKHAERYLEVETFQPYGEIRDADDFDTYDPELNSIALVAFGKRVDLSNDRRGGACIPHDWRSLEGSKLGRYVDKAIGGEEYNEPAF